MSEQLLGTQVARQQAEQLQRNGEQGTLGFIDQDQLPFSDVPDQIANKTNGNTQGEYVGQHRNNYEGRHQTETTDYAPRHEAPLEVGRHRVAEVETRNPNRWMARIGNRIGSLANKLQATAERRTLRQTAAETTASGRAIAGKVGKSLVEGSKALGNDIKANAGEDWQTLKEMGADAKKFVKEKWAKHGEAATRRKEARKAFYARRRENLKTAAETSAKVSKNVGKGALIGAGVAVALPVAVTGAALAGGFVAGYKGTDLAVRGAKAGAKKVGEGYNYGKQTVRVNTEAAQLVYHDAQARRHTAKAAKHEAKK